MVEWLPEGHHAKAGVSRGLEPALLLQPLPDTESPRTSSLQFGTEEILCVDDLTTP